MPTAVDLFHIIYLLGRFHVIQFDHLATFREPTDLPI